MGEFVFFVETHGHAEIVLAEEEDVHAGDRGNFVDILDAIGGFDLQRDDSVFVPVACVAEQAIFVHAALWKVDGASAYGRIFCAAHSLPCFGGGVDVGNEQTVGAHIE